MKFGVFDHMDDAGIPHGELFAGRLRLAEAYDRAFMAITLPSITARRSAARHRPAFSSPRWRSARPSCASARWFICCRSIIRCG
jgi:hypothetical protein